MGRKELVALKVSEKAVQVLFYFLKSASTCLEGEKNKKKILSVAPPVYFAFDSHLPDSYEAISACLKRVLKQLFYYFSFCGSLFCSVDFLLSGFFLNTTTGQLYFINNYVLSLYITMMWLYFENVVSFTTPLWFYYTDSYIPLAPQILTM